MTFLTTQNFIQSRILMPYPMRMEISLRTYINQLNCVIINRAFHQVLIRCTLSKSTNFITTFAYVWYFSLFSQFFFDDQSAYARH